LRGEGNIIYIKFLILNKQPNFKLIMNEKLSKRRENKPLELTEKSFVQIIKSEKPVIVNFYSSKCDKCYIIPSSFDRLTKKYDDHMIFGKLNLLESLDNKRVADKCNILLVPTFVIFKNGELQDRLVNPSMKELEKFIIRYISFIS